MTKSRDSEDAVVESSSSSVQAGAGNQNSQKVRRLEESARGQLEKALDAEPPTKKNYHIRSALQALVIREEDVPTN